MKASNIIWGLILVFVGAIFLLENFDVIDFNWGVIWRFWPLYLIIWGVHLISKRNLIITGALTLVSLALITYKGVTTESKPFFINIVDDEEWENNEVRHYDEDYSDSVQYAKLELSGGANKFEIDQTTSKLFSAEAKGSRGYFVRKIFKDSTANVEFGIKGGKGIRLDNDGLGEAKIKLNTLPVWDVEVKMGAGEVDFDLRKFKVNKLSLKGGAAEFDVKLGEPVTSTELLSETGMASVTIHVPKNVGCQIKCSSGLSSNDFDGFTSVSKDLYQTANFDASPKKIYLVLKGGLSDLKVKRY